MGQFLLGLVVIRREEETVVRTRIDRSGLHGLSVCMGLSLTHYVLAALLRT